MISDATTRVKLLAFVSQSGESQPRQNENIPNFSLPNFDSSAKEAAKEAAKVVVRTHWVLVNNDVSTKIPNKK